MIEREQILDEENVNSTVEQPYVETSNDNDVLVKTAIGAFVGAVVGALAVNIARQFTVENVNNTVKGVGNAVKGAAEGINNTAKGVGNAVKSVAENANHTVKDVGETVKFTAEDFNQNIKGTVDAMKSTTQSVNSHVTDAANVVKATVQEVNNTVKGAVDTVYEQQIVTENSQSDTDEVSSEQSKGTQTAYMLVPVAKGKVIGQPIPVDVGTVIPGASN